MFERLRLIFKGPEALLHELDKTPITGKTFLLRIRIVAKLGDKYDIHSPLPDLDHWEYGDGSLAREHYNKGPLIPRKR